MDPQLEHNLQQKVWHWQLVAGASMCCTIIILLFHMFAQEMAMRIDWLNSGTTLQRNLESVISTLNQHQQQIATLSQQVLQLKNTSPPLESK